MKIELKKQNNVLFCRKDYMDKFHISYIILYMEVNIIVKNKIVKTLSLGLCCIIFSVLTSTNIPPQNDKTTLTPISINEIIVTPNAEPPFH